MGCAVLRCEAESAHVHRLDRHPGMPMLETVVCDYHHHEIEVEKQPWRWDDADEVLHVGSDLDAGGALVPTQFSIHHDLGKSEVVIECRTPAGEYHEPIRFHVPDDEVQVWWDFLQARGPVADDGA